MTNKKMEHHALSSDIRRSADCLHSSKPYGQELDSSMGVNPWSSARRRIKLPFKINQTVLALGTQTKNTVCFAEEMSAYLSPVHQDLSRPEDFLKFRKDVKYFLKKHPKIIASDLHEEYVSTKFARNLTLRTSGLRLIQHHHAHIASCMLENGLKNKKVIGVAFDGTGLGSDGTLWGAEFLVCDYKNYIRRAHLKQIPLLGSEKAITEPWRLAFAWLYQAYGKKIFNLELNFFRHIKKNNLTVLEKMYLSGFNSPLTSSIGRLFDAVGSLVLEKYKIEKEAELAIELEKIASCSTTEACAYNFKIIKHKDRYIVDPSPAFKQIISDLGAGKPKETIAHCFHSTVAKMILKVSCLLRKDTGINKIVLSGGVFQNRLLLGLSLDLLSANEFEVLTHRILSSGDSSISLGQAAVANFLTPGHIGLAGVHLYARR